jgi:hypothetical protein
VSLLLNFALDPLIICFVEFLITQQTVNDLQPDFQFSLISMELTPLALILLEFY